VSAGASYVAVIGASVATAEQERVAEEVGQGLGQAGAIVITGGGGGVMAAASRGAAQAGGTVLSPAFDVMEVGRMAVIQDPTGAIFSLWQPKSHAGTTIGGVDNTFCWADLSTPNPEQASKFYAELFGWQLMKDEKDPSGYIHIKNGENFIGGIPPATHRNPGAPPHWLIYFQVAEAEAATAKAAEFGGKVLMPPRKMENVGIWSIVADPQGAVFALFKSAR